MKDIPSLRPLSPCSMPSLCPLLIVRGAAQAIEFYRRALGARLLARYEHGAERRISHAELALGNARFSLTEELPAWNSDAPDSLGGSPVVLQLSVGDAAGALQAMCSAGASVLFPLQAFAGELMARVRDPFGHLWIVRQPLEELSVEEIQRRRDELFAQLSTPQSAFRDGQAPAPVPSSSATSGAARDVSSIGSGPASGQAPNAPGAPAPHTGRVHLLIGPVGAGKSTFAQRLARERAALHCPLDDWMATLFRPDRPETGLHAWYRERAQRCIDQIWKLTQQLTARGGDVVLEIGLLQRAERERFYERVAEAGLPLTIYVIDAARDVRRARVEERNRNPGATFSMPVPAEIFELASDLWQAPEEDECKGRDVHFLRTDGNEC
jgi:uncharacterized glyoxalase superfamily protein PhnB/predicted kinase